jgi:hypothetical protein
MRVGVWQLCVKGGDCVLVDSEAEFWSRFGTHLIVARAFGACAICASIIPVIIHFFLAWVKRRGRPALLSKQRRLHMRKWSWGAGIAELIFTAIFGASMATMAEDPDSFGPAFYLTIGAWLCCAALLAAVDRKMAATVAKEAQRNLGTVVALH